MSTFTIYVKRKGGSDESAQKAVTLLKTYLTPIIAKSTKFTSSDVQLVDESTTPSLLKTDVIVYMVKNLSKSVISKQGGSVALAEANQNVLGLTDLTKKICEVYFDRMYDGSPKELAGSIYHEAAHILSNKDNSLHTGQNGFLKDAPDYNGTPTDKNTEFMANHLGRDLNMNAGY
jgi:hypothetical protein